MDGQRWARIESLYHTALAKARTEQAHDPYSASRSHRSPIENMPKDWRRIIQSAFLPGLFIHDSRPPFWNTVSIG
jgi:hypothetical protein